MRERFSNVGSGYHNHKHLALASVMMEHGSYMKLKERILHGLPRILSLFLNSFNKFSNTGARMLDSFYHMTFRLL